VIDKIELRLPPLVDFSGTVNAQLRQFGAARPSQHYSGVLDLRPHGFDAMLHYRKRREEHTHKLELFETGQKSYSELAALIESVVDGDCDLWELTRIDLCADIHDVPVSWFHDHARIRFKQLERRVGPLTSDVICRTHIETLTLGARPNVIRIYDKISEEKSRFRKDCRRQSRDADPLDFEQEFGHRPDETLTRIERQYGGGRLPDSLRTFGLIGNAASVDPFENIELNPHNQSIPRVEDYDLGEWLKGMQLRNERQARGAHNFKRWLHKVSNGNASRWMRHYAAFMPGASAHSITKSDILRVYRESTVRQLAA